MPVGLRSLRWKILYSREDGNLADLVLRPALAQSIRYDRSAGYFTAATLVMAADGIEALVRNGGTIRLIVGSLVTKEEADAIDRGERTAAEVAEVKASQPLNIPDDVGRDALELLAWLVAQGRLAVRFALPRRAEDGRLDLDHIFHQKTAIFTDAQGDSIGFNGSANETPAGWILNWESMNLFRSWDGLRPVLDALVDNFEGLWNGRMKSAYVVDIPRAMREQIIRFSPPDGELPRSLAKSPSEPIPTPEHTIQEWRDVRSFLSDTPALRRSIAVGAATSAVEPWPHQWRAFRRMYEPWREERKPPRILIADEVGLGKTIEAGLLLRQAVMAGVARRVLVMVPAAVLRQWQRELREKFALDWPIYDGDHFTYGSGGLGRADRRRPAPPVWTNEPFVIASSHLLRRRDRQREVLEAVPWDLIVVDEVHHARREAAGTPGEGPPNRLLEFLQRLDASGKLRGLVMLSATPMQTALVELFDLLAILGLPGRWKDRLTFENFFERLRRRNLSDEDCASLVALVQDGLRGLSEGPALLGSAVRASQMRPIEQQKVENLLRTASPNDAKALKDDQRETLRGILRRSTPVAALLSRHTRPLLRNYGVRIANRHPEDLFVDRSSEEKAIHDDVEQFIRHEFQRAQQLERGRKQNAVGFVLAIYGKRLTSSLEALRLTLKRHADKLNKHFGHGDSDADEMLDDDSTSGLVIQPEDSADASRLEMEGAALLEQDRIRQITQRIDAFYARSLDAKLGLTRKSLRDLQGAGFDQAIIFTQFTDTLDWLRARLADWSILCYSGRGGEYLAADGSWQHLSRDDTKERFASGESQLLICTDAAAEGLNLQTCGALINYDLPWNPMRVEQRIGRIDRIGQPRDVIRVVNLYYPGTIETAVYERLQQRIDLFGATIGKLQPILARTATFIERSRLEGESIKPVLDDLDKEIDRLRDSAFDLDASVLDDLATAGRMPDPPYDLPQLSMLLDRPGLLPAGYETRSLGSRQWGVRTAPGGIESRVTIDLEFYDRNVEDYELWTYGSKVFPKLDPPRDDVRESDYPASLRDLINE